MAKECEHCGFTNNPDTAHYCGKCGQPLEKYWHFVLDLLKSDFAPEEYVVVRKRDYDSLQSENRNLQSENRNLRNQLENTWSARAKRRWKKVKDEVSIWGIFVLVIVGVSIFWEPISSWVSSWFSGKEGVEIRAESGKYGLFNHDEDRQTLPFEYDTIIPYKNEQTDFYLIHRQGHWGLADHAGVRTVDCMLDSLQWVKSGGLLRLFGNGKQGLADWQGNLVLPCTYHRVLWEENPHTWTYFYDAGDYVGDIIPVKRSADGLWTLHDRSGKRIVDDAFRYVAQSGSPDLVRVSRKYSYRDWGLVDATGNIVVPLEYDKYDLSVYGDGRAWKKEGKVWTCMDEQGKTIYTLPADKQPGIYSEGLCVVYSGDYIEYYDKEGKQVIPPKYKAVKGDGFVYTPNFYNGRAYVSYNGQPGYIDKQGNFTEKKSDQD